MNTATGGFVALDSAAKQEYN
jgi:hypothetical protein